MLDSKVKEINWRAARQGSGWSIQALVEETGIRKSTLQAILDKRINPEPYQARLLIRVLQIRL